MCSDIVLAGRQAGRQAGKSVNHEVDIMQKAVAIVTELGALDGRDCIFLSSAEQDDRGSMIITGDINGALVSKHKGEKRWFPYKCIFRGVLACFSCELDTYENLDQNSWKERSCFDQMEGSEWLEALPVREDFDKSKYRHYRLFTYDVVYHIIAAEYQLEIDI